MPASRQSAYRPYINVTFVYALYPKSFACRFCLSAIGTVFSNTFSVKTRRFVFGSRDNKPGIRFAPSGGGVHSEMQRNCQKKLSTILPNMLARADRVIKESAGIKTGME